MSLLDKLFGSNNPEEGGIPQGSTTDFALEWIKYQKNPALFIENEIKLELAGGDVPLKMHKGQRQLLKAFILHKYLIVLKSRQIGITTIMQAICVWLAIFFKNVGVGIVSKDGPASTDFAKQVIKMLDKVQSKFKFKYTKKTERQFELNTGFKMFSETVSPERPENTLRGKPITLLIIDEAAFARKLDTAYTGMAPALGTAHRQAEKENVPYGAVILSTPNGCTEGTLGYWYYSSWCDAKRGIGLFKALKIHWSEIPEFNSKNKGWYELQCNLLKGDHEKIAQELDLKFLTTNDSKIFDAQFLELLNTSVNDPSKNMEFRVSGNPYNLQIWKTPDKCIGKTIIAIDSATSYGKDFTCITGMDSTTGEQVFELFAKCSSTHIPILVKKIMDIYPNNITVFENDGIGEPAATSVADDLFYADRIYHTITKSKEGFVTKAKPGISQRANRDKILEAFFEEIKANPNNVRSMNLYLQICGLQKTKSGKIEGKPHDDAVFAWAICCYIKKYNVIDSKTGILQAAPNEHELSDSELAKAISLFDDDIKPIYDEPITHNLSPLLTQSNTTIDMEKLLNSTQNNPVAQSKQEKYQQHLRLKAKPGIIEEIDILLD